MTNVFFIMLREDCTHDVVFVAQDEQGHENGRTSLSSDIESLLYSCGGEKEEICKLEHIANNLEIQASRIRRYIATSARYEHWYST